MKAFMARNVPWFISIKIYNTFTVTEASGRTSTED
jgi:hypothetical protein